MSKKAKPSESGHKTLSVVRKSRSVTPNENNYVLKVDKTLDFLCKYFMQNGIKNNISIDNFEILKIDPSQKLEIVIHELKLKLNEMIDQDASEESRILGYLLIGNMLLGYQHAESKLF